ncbi:hypothetical protein PRIPAC_72406 [Pristionchus pacificus]|uniref:Uncharacterized protein n=1 Tax=Pristionchus pacificus TaxID=54126 RepID=A0A2A6CRC7_PRIPA|nr:hypothetical protein PRIPAC_72406 [Pristionchus pacificus]|eukprot:PDM80755.1 hypothetical protein PRIPAC_35758 [Pristionchus pacificus]
MRLRHLLLLFIAISSSLAEMKRLCVCGTRRIPCECPPEQTNKLNNLRNRVFRAFSVPSAPAPKPIQPQYFVLSRNVQSNPYVPSFNIDQPIGYVLTTSAAEAFYLDATTGQLVPTTRPRQFQQQLPVTNPTISQPPSFPQQYQQYQQQSIPQPPLTTASRQSFLVSGGVSQTAFRPARMIAPVPPSIALYRSNPGIPSFAIPPQGLQLPVSAPYYPPIQYRNIQSQQSRTSIPGWSEPNLVPVSQLTRVVKQRHAKKFTLEKPRPGDVEDFSFVDTGNGVVVEESDIDRKYKSFMSGSPPSASIGEPAEIVRTKPRSLLETLPPGFIAKVANKIASKLPPPKMTPTSILFLLAILQCSFSKPFVADFPLSSSLIEPTVIENTKPQSLLETLPSGLIAKMMKKIMVKLPPPKFTFSIKPSKSKHSSSEHERKAHIL